MSLTLTLVLMAAFAAVGLVSAWRGAAPPDPRRGPRLIPYRFVMVLCGAAALYLAAHLLSLFGVTPTR